MRQLLWHKGVAGVRNIAHRRKYYFVSTTVIYEKIKELRNTNILISFLNKSVMWHISQLCKLQTDQLPKVYEIEKRRNENKEKRQHFEVEWMTETEKIVDSSESLCI
jgi:hypothetical protein